jgi:FkbM family methyltransferase
MKPFLRLRSRLFHARVRRKLERHLVNAREVAAAFADGGTPMPTLRLHNGSTIRGRKDDQPFGMFWEMFVEGCYLGDPSFYRPKPDDTIVNVGANIGVFDIQCCAAEPNLRIISAEPDPGTFGMLMENLKENKIDSRVSAFNVAVADKAGSLFFKSGAEESGHRVLASDGQGTEVPCITLDELFDRGGVTRCDLLKIDTEGSEGPIVRGASPSLWPKVARVVVEYHDHVVPESRKTTWDVLTSAGFTCRDRPMPGYPGLGLIFATR